MAEVAQMCCYESLLFLTARKHQPDASGMSFATDDTENEPHFLIRSFKEYFVGKASQLYPANGMSSGIEMAHKTA